MPVSILLDVVRAAKFCRSLEIVKKTLYVGSTSLKVIEFVTNGKVICDFLLVVNSNLGHVSLGFKNPLGRTPSCLT